jgi:aspartate/tyrosine/aromatic aminotransferase
MGSIEIPDVPDSHYGLAAIPKAPADFLMGLKKDFFADESPEKVALVVGAYRDEKGRPWRLPSVIEVSVVPGRV